MKKLYLALAAVGALAAIPATAAEQRIEVGVGELTCPTCSYTVAAAMRDVPSVEIIEFAEGEEFGTGTFTVAYDDEAADPDTIVEAIRATGYPAEVVRPGDS
ncbi:periplasmic mercury ion-binding protein [Rhodobacteraceae bacterium 2CG4]|uniref:Periplasmic mercury ion-binding protein n=1 Tax=Halovulum marinum TaxID=2662447 RepID=A0A6L5Z2X6_9RHOB|nr:heavy-metal-associated domain-containing protein [Halovulum marinum]MSU90344.1 periplasmic mercury ion-binding protein [Halovulum marinum]